MSSFRINGVVPIIPTPFQSDETVGFAALTPLVDFAVAGGCSAICLPAYASEFYKLSDEECLEVVRHAVEAARGRIPVIGQANHASARLAANSARAVEAAGADAIAVAVPLLFGLPERDLFRYFEIVLSAIRIPLLIQDYSQTQSHSGCDRRRRGRLGRVGWGGIYVRAHLPASGYGQKALSPRACGLSEPACTGPARQAEFAA